MNTLGIIERNYYSLERELFRGSDRRRGFFALRSDLLLPVAAGVFSFFVSDGPISFNSERNGGKNAGKNYVFAFPHALCPSQICCCAPHVHADLPVSFRQRIVSATAPLPLMPTPNNVFGSTVATVSGSGAGGKSVRHTVRKSPCSANAWERAKNTLMT